MLFSDLDLKRFVKYSTDTFKNCLSIYVNSCFLFNSNKMSPIHYRAH